MPNDLSKGSFEPRDAELWDVAMRGVLPLRRRPRAVSAPAISSVPKDNVSDGGKAARGSMPLALDRFVGVDRATAERLKRGQRTIEARLDLHGMTQAEAHRTLAGFVRASSAAGRRCVLVVTGRGRGPEGLGVLKSSVPRWLAEAELGRHILAIASAQPRHGGAGALYLLLRRQR